MMSSEKPSSLQQNCSVEGFPFYTKKVKIIPVISSLVYGDYNQ